MAPDPHAPVRVAFVVPSFAIGGTERVTATVVQGLGEAFEVTVVAPDARGTAAFLAGTRAAVRPLAIFEPGMRERANGEGAGWEPSPARQLASRPAVARAARTAQAVLRQLTWRRALRLAEHEAGALPRHDVVHVVNGGYPGSTVARAWAAVAGRATGAAVVLSVHGEAQRRRGIPWLERGIDARVGRGVDAFVVPAGSLARALAARRPFAPDRIVAIPNGVADRAPSPPAGAKEGARRRLGVPAGATVVLSVSRLDVGKGLERLVDGFALLAQERDDVHLVVVGEGPSAPDLRARVASHSCTGRVTFTGYLSPTDDAYAAADVAVLLSEAEGLPLALLEAMMWRLPVVATAVGAVPEIVTGGDTGILLASGDGDAVSAAGAIRSVVADADVARRMGLAGRARYEERYTEAALVRRHEELYERLLRERPSASP